MIRAETQQSLFIFLPTQEAPSSLADRLASERAEIMEAIEFHHDELRVACAKLGCANRIRADFARKREMKSAAMTRINAHRSKLRRLYGRLSAMA